MKRFFITILIIFLLPTLSGAADHYFTESGGESTKDGKTYATSWAISVFNTASNWSASAGDNSKIRYGDTIYLCGTLTPASFIYPRLDGDTSNYIIIDGNCHKANGDADHGTLDVRRSLTGEWALDAPSETRWLLASTNNPSRMWFTKGGTETEGQRVYSAAAVDAENKWYYDTTGKNVYVYGTESPTTYYTTIKDLATPNQGLTFTYGSEWGHKGYIVQNLTFKGGYIANLTISGANNIIIQNNNFGNGVKGMSIGGTGTTRSTYITIANNNVDSNYAGLDNSNASDRCLDGIWLEEGFDNIKIYGNTVKNWGHVGIGAINYTTTFDATTDVQIYDNDVSAPDMLYGVGIDIFGALSQTTGVRVYDNYVHDMPCFGMVIGGTGTKVVNNRIYNVFGSTRTGKAGCAAGIDFIGYYYQKPSPVVNVDSDADGCEVYGNYVSTTKDPGLLINEAYNGADSKSTGNKFLNNTLYNTGYDTTNSVPYSIWVKDSAKITGLTFSGNTIFPPTGTNARGAADNEIYYRGTGYTTVLWPMAVAEGDVIAGATANKRRR